MFDAFPTLAEGQQAQLAALPLQHDPLSLALRRPLGSQAAHHARGLRAARRFYRTHQHLRVPAAYLDDRSNPRFPLGKWIADLHVLANAGILSREEIDSVEALAMEWAPRPQYESTPATLPGTSTDTTDEYRPVQWPQPTPGIADAHEHSQEFWVAGREPSPPMLPDVILNGGRRMLLSMPAGGGKTMTVATAVHEAASRACLVLGPDRTYLHHVVKTWRMVSRGPLAGINIRPTNSGKAGAKLSTAGQLADWMAQQPPGALVVARYSDAGLIVESHRDHHLPPWDYLVVEDAHRTFEGITSSDRPHAVIHYDDGILAYKRVYLTATPRIPSELPGDRRTEIAWAVDMPSQPIFGTHHPSVDRVELVDKGLLSPYQLMRIRVPELPRFPTWRAQALGAAHLIEQHHLRRVVAVLRDRKQAEAFACQLAVQMLDAEILIPGQGAVRYPHNQPVIRCQRATDPTPPTSTPSYSPPAPTPRWNWSTPSRLCWASTSNVPRRQRSSSLNPMTPTSTHHPPRPLPSCAASQRHSGHTTPLVPGDTRLAAGPDEEAATAAVPRYCAEADEDVRGNPKRWPWAARLKMETCA